MFDLNLDPGTGNLNVRAYLASVVGPRRVAHGRRTVKVVPQAQSLSMLGTPSGVEVAYFEVWLPLSSLLALGGGGAVVAFSSSENTGQDAFQILLTPSQRYSGVLLPDDQLYARAVSDALGAPIADVSLVISSVVF